MERAARTSMPPVEVLEAGGLEGAVDALYALPPEQFVPAREALVKRLRAAKRRDEAATVHALPRPSAAASALGAAVRRDLAAVDALVASGRALLEAQRDALTGGDAARVRDASADRDALVRRLAAAAADVLHERGGNGTAQLDALRGTLEAASVVAGVAADLRRGRLVRTVEPPSGFDLLAQFDVPVPARPPDSSGRSTARTGGAATGTAAIDDGSDGSDAAAHEREQARAREDVARAQARAEDRAKAQQALARAEAAARETEDRLARAADAVRHREDAVAALEERLRTEREALARAHAEADAAGSAQHEAARALADARHARDALERLDS